jgi:putative hemolysin
MLLPGALPIHDLPDHGADVERLEDSDYTTVASVVLTRLGHIPTAPGDVVDIGGHTAEVVEITGRAITGIRLRKVATGESVENDI